MDLIQDSKDLLFVVIAFSVLFLSAFIAWFIYYLVMMMKEFFKVARDMRERIKKVDETIDILKKKIEHSASYLSLIGDGVRKIVDIAKDHNTKKKKTKAK